MPMRSASRASSVVRRRLRGAPPCTKREPSGSRFHWMTGRAEIIFRHRGVPGHPETLHFAKIAATPRWNRYHRAC
ncbi:hypothetical protein A33K_15696 [Burkholderia humptydooensis MSMB43]|uniref:Uncharacterized protein n=1 Tax=Burkholderia humptydooensis MSMB43 TaxID=441157 RepID=A0ABN0G5Y6_9BURK|nr:hypothetical protein A33K_15696 [Burkholderia humptydooensis MSMB43]